MDSQLMVMIILVLIGFILGMIVGVSISRPNIVG